MQVIEICGRASLKSWKLTPDARDYDKSLLDYLIDQGFSVASSCSGQKKCRKCVYDHDKLACDITVQASLGKQIYFDYM